MKIDLETIIIKHNNCVVALDPEKKCATCKYESYPMDRELCASCYDEMIGLPVNPTKWEGVFYD